MIHPNPEELSQGGKYNRYTLVVATAKCARKITDEYISQRTNAEKLIANRETDKPLASMIKKEYRDEKAVTTAVHKLMDGDYVIVDADGNKI